MFPNHFIGFLGAFQIAVFAFMGSGLVGTTAAETQDPEETLPKDDQRRYRYVLWSSTWARSPLS